MNEGARPQRLLWASTGTKDPDASDVLYIEGFASPFTVNTMPEPTLLAFADHGEVGDPVPADGGDCDEVLAEFGEAGIDVAALATRLQEEGKEAFVKSWNELLKIDRVPGRGARVSDGPALRQATRLAGAQKHYGADPARSTCATSSPPTRSAASGWSPTAPVCTSTSPRTGSPTRR